MNAWLQPEPLNWWQVVDDALQEDVGSGDISTGFLDPSAPIKYSIEIQGNGVLSGIGIVEYLLSPYSSDQDARLSLEFSDGDPVEPGDIVAHGVIPARRALMVERTLLNFLMMMSGVATLTSKYVEKIDGTSAKIVDTRKTLPGLRSLQKYAVRCGGGSNHRMGLYDGVMIKDNHILAAGGIQPAVEKIRAYISHLVKIEVECTSLEQVREAIDAGAEVIMLDNMDPFMMREAVKEFEGQAIFEASGGISLETVRGVAQTGVDYISVGALTHSAPGLPLHMEFEL